MAPDAAIPIGGPLLEHVLDAAALVVLVDLAPWPQPTPTVLAPVPCALAVVIAVCSRLLGSAPRAPSCIVIAAVSVWSSPFVGFAVGFRPGARFVCVARKRIWGYVPPRSDRVWSCLCVWREAGVTSRPVSLCWAGRWLLPDCPCFRLLGAPSPPTFACVRDVCPSVPVFARVARRCAARVLH